VIISYIISSEKICNNKEAQWKQRNVSKRRRQPHCLHLTFPLFFSPTYHPPSPNHHPSPLHHNSILPTPTPKARQKAKDEMQNQRLSLPPLTIPTNSPPPSAAPMTPIALANRPETNDWPQMSILTVSHLNIEHHTYTHRRRFRRTLYPRPDTNTYLPRSRYVDAGTQTTSPVCTSCGAGIAASSLTSNGAQTSTLSCASTLVQNKLEEETILQYLRGKVNLFDVLSIIAASLLAWYMADPFTLLKAHESTLLVGVLIAGFFIVRIGELVLLDWWIRVVSRV